MSHTYLDAGMQATASFWHSLGEAYLNGKWLKLDATILADIAAQKGKPYIREFDGKTDIPTVEGPVIKGDRELRRVSLRRGGMVRADGKGVGCRRSFCNREGKDREQ